MNKKDFTKVFLKDGMVGALFETSLYGVKKVCRLMDFSKKTILVEYGPGSGVFTKFILGQMTADSKIIAIESNKEFVDCLNKINDPRLVVVNDKAENILRIIKESGFGEVDYVISGIPFSFFKEEMRVKMVQNTFDALRVGGKFIVYQYSFLMAKYLKKRFPKVNLSWEVRNLPPEFVMEAIK